MPGPDTPPTGSGSGAIAAAAGFTTMGQLPLALLSAQAVLVADDLSLSEAGLGLAASMFFVTSAVTVVPAGRMVERLGHRLGGAVAAGLAAASLLGTGVAARSFPLLLVFLALGGLANATAQMSSNLLVARRVAADNQGLAFGVKQAAIPIALTVSGLAMPLVGALLGWRWSYGAAGCGAALTIAVVLLRRRGGATIERPTGRRGGVARRVPASLLVIAAATTAGAATVSALSAFLSVWATRSGMSAQHAALLLAAVSAACVAARIGIGTAADRWSRGHLVAVTLQLVGGAVGLALLATGQLGVLMAGALLAFAVGWSWPGLLLHALVRVHPEAPASATSVIQAGSFLGGALGPAAFGALIHATSFSGAWLGGSLCLLLAAALLDVGRRLLARETALASR